MALSTQIRCGAKSHQGRIRENNEDCFLVLTPDGTACEDQFWGHLFAVSDGMGGHVAGEIASRMACDILKAEFCKKEKAALSHAVLADLFRKINHEIHHFSDQNGQYAGMGTTLSAVVCCDNKAWLAHVGDSRIYRLRENRLEQLTRDQTHVQALMDMGRITAAEARHHPLSHVLTQAMGTDKNVKEIQTDCRDLAGGDQFLICSDGLTDMVTNTDIMKILTKHDDPITACDDLVEKALDGGGKDNVTVVIAKIPL